MTSQVEGGRGAGAGVGVGTFPYDSQSFYNPPISPEFFFYNPSFKVNYSLTPIPTIITHIWQRVFFFFAWHYDYCIYLNPDLYIMLC